MNKIKFLLFNIVGLLSFSSCFAFDLSSDQVSLLDQIALNSGSVSNQSLPVLYEVPNPDSSNFLSLCVVFYGFSRSSDFGRIPVFQDTAQTRTNTPYYGVPSPYSLTCATGRRRTFYLATSSTSAKFTINKFRVVDSSDLMGAFGFTSGGGGSDCSVLSGQLNNCLEEYEILSGGYESLKSQFYSLSGQLTNCVNNYNYLSGFYYSCENSLSSCQSDLSSCQGGADAAYLQCLEDRESCQTAFNTLSGQYLSCVNYNSSLSDQLNECLENSSGSGDELICNTYSLNRYNGNETFSSQIKNNLWLPRGYKGYLDEGVLGIKNIYDPDYAYSLDSEEFEKVVSSYGILFLFLFSGGLFVLFLYVIRKYFTSLFK